MDSDIVENSSNNSASDALPNKPPTERRIDVVYTSSEEDDDRRHAALEVDELMDPGAVMPLDNDDEEAEITECNTNDVSNYVAEEILMPQHREAAGIFLPTIPKPRDNDSKKAKENSLREKIRAIAADKSLTALERDAARQKLYSHNYKSRRRTEATNHFKRCKALKHKRSISKHSDARGKRLLGCTHYPRNCKIRADCCGMWVVCRHCHDVSCVTSDHSIDRFATKRILCMLCNTEQPVRNRCLNSSCGVRFAKYFCGSCKFWDNTPKKEIYHCDKCRLCRVGKGLGRDNYHCDKCNACVSLEEDGADAHRCLKSSLDADCPVCGGHMLTSTAQVVFMQCGHTMHLKCFDEYTENNYVCPICSQALTDMRPYYAQIDKAVENQPLPPEYSNKKVEVLCHDCDVRSVTKFHFIYFKCMSCDGYNTRLIKERADEEECRVLKKDNNIARSKG